MTSSRIMQVNIDFPGKFHTECGFCQAPLIRGAPAGSGANQKTGANALPRPSRLLTDLSSEFLGALQVFLCRPAPDEQSLIRDLYPLFPQRVPDEIKRVL